MNYFSALLFIILVPRVALAVQVTGSITNPNCGQANGSIIATASGGQAPYTYNWTPVPPAGNGTPQITGLGPGLWSVTVTDNLGAQATAGFTLNNLQWITNVEQAMTWLYDGIVAHHPCPGSQNGSIALITSMLNGTPPYTTDLNGQPPIGYDLTTNEPYFGYFSATDQVYLNVTDATGCMGSGYVVIDSPPVVGTIASNIDPACGGLANGSADINVGIAGPYGPEVVVNGPGGDVYFGTPSWDPLSLSGLEAGSYVVVRTYVPQYFPDPGCQFAANFTIPDLGPDCGTVQGRLFLDHDQDCVQDGNDEAIPYRVLQIDPGAQLTITNGTGEFTRNLSNGNFTLSVVGTGVDLHQICPAAQPAPFTIAYNTVVVDIADSSLIPLDIRVTGHGSQARPGFTQQVWIDVDNLSGQLSGPITLMLEVDPQMSFLNASNAPMNVIGNTVTWALPGLGAFGGWNTWVSLQVPPNPSLIGQPYAHVLNASQPFVEIDLLNNDHAVTGAIEGAYDPNDKRAFTSTRASDALYFIDTDEWIDYVVRFQNTGTAEAIDVVVTDTLPMALDMASFQQGTASHSFEVSFKPGRVVEWRFAGINLPDSGANEAASHGLVNFRIRPHLPLAPGTMIENMANIFFDLNPPVITEPSVLTAEFSTGVEEPASSGLELAPVPASLQLRVAASDRISTVRVLSADGREMLLRSMGSRSAELDISQLPAGSYMLIASFTNGTTAQKRFIKH